MNIARNLQEVHERMAAAARRSHRDLEEVTLVAVTKGHPTQSIQEAIEAGARHIGENYVEEAVSKKEAISNPETLIWHMIGHVQSRKARLVCEHFDWMHSLDSLKLARRLDQFAGEARKPLPVLLECNVSGEQTKSGWPVWEADSWESFAGEAAEILDLPNLEVQGLMCMPPYFDDPQDARPFFQRLRALQSFLEKRFPRDRWHKLSMGMSSDFEVAIEEGATFIRVGTAIFGLRSAVPAGR